MYSIFPLLLKPLFCYSTYRYSKILRFQDHNKAETASMQYVLHLMFISLRLLVSRVFFIWGRSGASLNNIAICLQIRGIL